MATLKNKEKRQDLRHDLYRRLETDGVPLPQTVKELRKILGLNQAAFAKMLGQSLSTLRKIEQQSGNVTLESVLKILEKFSLELVVKRQQRP
jgi:DNA-binding transcriptional regulator YiaG